MADERVVPGKTHIHNVQKHIARYNVALQYCNDVKVLDIASGSGYGSKLLSWVAKEVRGVDNDREAYDYALKHFGASNITYELADFYDAKGQYDTIVCFETIEHLEDLEKAQNKLVSMLKPGGILIFSVPLNEEPGFNEHHKHVFKVSDARELFPQLQSMGELMQMGVNFFQVDENWDKNFTYYIAVKKLS